MAGIYGVDGAKLASAVKAEDIPGLGIGRIVHYFQVDDDGGKGIPRVFAAIVTEVGEGGAVDLTVFMPNTSGFVKACPFHKSAPNADYKDGCWSWPPRVGGA